MKKRNKQISYPKRKKRRINKKIGLLKYIKIKRAKKLQFSSIGSKKEETYAQQEKTSELN